MKLHPVALALLCLFSASLLPLTGAEKAKESPIKVKAVADRADALYRTGETVTFSIEVANAGQPAAGEVDWTLTKDGVDPTRQGRAALKEGKATVTGSLAEPGFLQLRVNYQSGGEKVSGLAGAGFSPTDIKPSLPAPDDFDSFWTAKKRELAEVPASPVLTPVKSPSTSVVAFDVQVASLGKPVSGYYARPADARPRGHPAILTVHGAGVRSAGLGTAAGWAREGALAFDVNAHGIPNGRDAAFYEALAAGDLKDYRAIGRTSRDTIYFLGMFLRLVRAIDFLTSQPEWDGRTVVVSGSSQGGAQAIAAAGLDGRVSFFAAGVPAMCDHTGALAGRIAGWPKFIPTRETPKPDVIAAVRYYDAVNFATRAKAPAIFTVGFIDTTCPPTSVYAAYNALTTPKEIHRDVDAGHTNTPAAVAATRRAILAHFAAMKAK